MTSESIRGNAVAVGDIIIIDGREITVAAIRPAVYRPDVTRVVTDAAGREVVMGTRNKYKRLR